MAPRGRADRLRVTAGGGDLIGDYHRQHRRKILKRAAQFTTLAVVLLLCGLAFKLVADDRARTKALDEAHDRFLLGTVTDLRQAGDVLESSLTQAPRHAPTQAALAMVRARIWLEFGEGEQPARDAVDAADSSEPDTELARAMIAFAEGEFEAAEKILEDASGDGAFSPGQRQWLDAMLVASRPAQDPEKLTEAIAAVEAVLESNSDSVAHRRARALLLLLSDRTEDALAELEKARDQSRSHMGLAADEALYNAFLRQELSGVADVADQLLASGADVFAPRDRAHALLARAVVHVHTGEPEPGLEMLDEAWEAFAPWDVLSRELAIMTALEAGDVERAPKWIEQTTLPEGKPAVYDAWTTLIEGDVMAALEALSKLPQEEPLVGYLQALALVEQRRFVEAGPWVQRTQKLLPGRVEIDVAQARIELRTEGADKAAALRKLKSLAEEEPYAPRAWTGLGEAYLLQDGELDLRNARKALQRAMKREPLPAEAMLLLADVYTKRRKDDNQAESKALELLEKAAKTNDKLPRYRQELGLYLADLGYAARAREILSGIVDEPGIEAKALIRLVALSVKAEAKADYDDLLEKAKKLGATPIDLAREQARVDIQSGDKDKIVAAQGVLLGLFQADPGDIESRVLYANGHLKLFDRQAAEAAVRKGLALAPPNKHGRLYLAWARIESRTGKASAAAPRARSAWIKMLEEDRPPAELLAAADQATRLWTRQKNARVTQAIARQVTDRLPYHAEAWTIRAAAELGSGDAGAARSSAERALDIDENNPRAHAIQGHALLRFGYKDKARKAYERAVELAAGTKAEKEYRENLRRL